MIGHPGLCLQQLRLIVTSWIHSALTTSSSMSGAEPGRYYCTKRTRDVVASNCSSAPAEEHCDVADRAAVRGSPR